MADLPIPPLGQSLVPLPRPDPRYGTMRPPLTIDELMMMLGTVTGENGAPGRQQYLDELQQGSKLLNYGGK